MTDNQTPSDHKYDTSEYIKIGTTQSLREDALRQQNIKLMQMLTDETYKVNELKIVLDRVRLSVLVIKEVFKMHDLAEWSYTIDKITALIQSQFDGSKITIDDWLPIHTAPKDGTLFDAWTSDGIRVPDAFWHVEENRFLENIYKTWPYGEPTHWRPKPNAPLQPKESLL